MKQGHYKSLPQDDPLQHEPYISRAKGILGGALKFHSSEDLKKHRIISNIGSSFIMRLSSLKNGF